MRNFVPSRVLMSTAILLALAWPAFALAQGLAAAAGGGSADILGTGLYTGFLLATALLNLVAACASQRMLHGCFALFVACTALRWFTVDALAGGLLPGNHDGWQLAANALLGAQMVTGSLCQIHLLDLRRHHPFLLRYYQWFGILPGVLVMLASASPFFDLVTRAMFVILLPAPLFSAPAYLRLWRNGGVAERCIAVALPLHFLVMLPATLGNIGLIPFDPGYIDLARNASLPVILALHAGIGLKVRALERERNDARLHAAEARAVADNERKAREEQERLVAVITHEVRTPVAVIDAAAYSLRLLDQDGRDAAAQRETRYRSIGQSVDRLRKLMALTEAMDRLQQGQADGLPADRIDLAEISAALRDTLAPADVARVDIQIDGMLPAVQGNARLIQVSLSNLLDNALKYAQPDTPIRIDIGIDPQRPGVRWRIRDVGPGIPPDKRGEVFERYRRLDEMSGKPGLGLGLPLSRQIVEQHGGWLLLEYRGAWPHGACFTVSLPIG